MSSSAAATRKKRPQTSTTQRSSRPAGLSRKEWGQIPSELRAKLSAPVQRTRSLPTRSAKKAKPATQAARTANAGRRAAGSQKLRSSSSAPSQRTKMKKQPRLRMSAPAPATAKQAVSDGSFLDAIRDDQHSLQEREAGLRVPEYVPYDRYGIGLGRKVALPLGTAATTIGADEEDEVLEVPPSKSEARHGFMTSVLDQVDLEVDGVTSLGSYQGPEGFMCDVIQFTKTTIEGPVTDSGNGAKVFGIAIHRRIEDCAFQITAAANNSFSWVQTVGGGDTSGDVPGYSTFWTLYNAYRPVSANLMIRPMGSDEENEGVVYGGRIAKSVDQLTVYWATLGDFQTSGQMVTDNLKHDIQLWTAPSDITDLHFMSQSQQGPADAAVALFMNVDPNQTFSVRRTWTVLALRKVNYLVGLSRVNFADGIHTHLGHISSKETPRTTKALLNAVPGGLPLTEEVRQKVQAYDAIRGLEHLTEQANELGYSEVTIEHPINYTHKLGLLTDAKVSLKLTDVLKGGMFEYHGENRAYFTLIDADAEWWPTKLDPKLLTSRWYLDDFHTALKLVLTMVVRYLMTKIPAGQVRPPKEFYEDIAEQLGRALPSVVYHMEVASGVGENDSCPTEFISRFFEAHYTKMKVRDIADDLRQAYLDEFHSRVDEIQDAPPGRDPFRLKTGFLSSIASMVSPDTVKAATGIMEKLPIIKDLADPINETFEATTGESLKEAAAHAWQWAKDGV